MAPPTALVRSWTFQTVNGLTTSHLLLLVSILFLHHHVVMAGLVVQLTLAMMYFVDIPRAVDEMFFLRLF